MFLLLIHFSLSKSPARLNCDDFEDALGEFLTSESSETPTPRTVSANPLQPHRTNPQQPSYSSLTTSSNLPASYHHWWDYVAALNSTRTPKHIQLRWNRSCSTCGVKLLTREHHTPQSCFVCGPNGKHLLRRLPPYPSEWDPILSDRRCSSLSRKLNNIFCLTGIGVHDGAFVKFPAGVSSVTLDGGRTYHLLRAAESQEGHAVRWFIHDTDMLHTTARSLSIPSGWTDLILRGLQRVNPYINGLESLARSDSDLALHLDQPDSITGDEVAAIVSLAPAAQPCRRKLIIKKKNRTECQFIDILSSLADPLHYVVLFPHGTLGWCLEAKEQLGFTQLRWIRSQIYLNADTLFKFGRLMGKH